MSERPIVEIEPSEKDPRVVAIRPKSFLDPTLFAAYRNACSGARYDATLRCQLASAEKLPAIVSRLHAHFALDLHPGVAVLLATEAHATNERVEEAATRAAQIDEMLKARGLRLYDFQKEDVGWIASRKRYLLAWDMGLGKTVGALVSVPSASTTGLLVVAPAVAKGVWQREIPRWRPDFKTVTVLSGRKLGICEKARKGRGPKRVRCPRALPFVAHHGRLDFKDLLNPIVAKTCLDARLLHLPLPASTVSGKTPAPETCSLGVDNFRWPKPGEVVIVNYDILPRVAAKPKIARPVRPKPVPKLRGGLAALGLVAPTPKIAEVPKAPPPPPPPDPVAEALAHDCPEGIYVVADEAHMLVNSKSQRTRSFRAISAAVRERGGSVGLLTATPQLNTRPTELWGVLEAADLAREAFGTFKDFMRMFGGKEGFWGGIEWPEYGENCPFPLPEVAERLRRVMIRRMKSEVLKDLPPKRYELVEVNLGASGLAACEEMDDALAIAGLDAEEDDFLDEEDSMIPFKEISALRAKIAESKIPAMLAVVEAHEEQNEPLLVFSAHRAPIDALADRPGWAVITGDTKDRAAIERDFQAGKYKGIGLTIQAGGVAITLTRAACELFVDRAWTPSLNTQAEDRAYRIGQTRGVLVTDLVGDHAIERRVQELLAQKRSLIERSIELMVGAPDKTPAIREALLEEIAEHARVAEEARRAREASRPKPRGPEGAREEWAARAMRLLSAFDPDCAQELNGVGWNKVDGALGKKFAVLAAGTGLTDRQWRLAIATCAKYHRQVGPMPKER